MIKKRSIYCEPQETCIPPYYSGDMCSGPGNHYPHRLRLKKIVWGYNNICLCSPAGYKKSNILRSCLEEYQEYVQSKNTI